MSGKLALAARCMGIALLSLALSVPAFADPPEGKGKKESHHAKREHDHKGKHEGKDKHGNKKRHAEHKRVIVTEDTIIINRYLHDHGSGGFCPPGLAKKHNGCLPPGQAKRYRIGEILSDDIVITPLPGHILARLRPPHGHYYAQIDGDVVLIAEASKKIIDAVTLLSAVQ